MEQAFYTQGQLLARRVHAKRRLKRRRAVLTLLAIAGAITAAQLTSVPQSPAGAPQLRTASLTVPAHSAVDSPSPPPASAPAPSAAQQQALASIPTSMLAVYHKAAALTGAPWQELAAIGANESDNGRSNAPGVHSGVNEANCCSGPAQLCIEQSCGAAWQLYGSGSVYDSLDAFEAAGRYLRVLAAEVGPSLALQLAAYNAGPTAVLRYGGVPPYGQTEAYVAKGVPVAVALGSGAGATPS